MRHVVAGLILLVVVMVAGPAYGQKYRTALGVRLARPDVGITLTQRLLERTTLEVVGSAYANDLTATALVRQHTGILGHALNFYMGLGPHIGDNQETGTYYGGTVVIGGEWKLPFFPIVIASDWMPSLSAHRPQRFHNSAGVSIRYVILKEQNEGFFKRLFGGKKNKKKA